MREITVAFLYVFGGGAVAFLVTYLLLRERIRSHYAKSLREAETQAAVAQAVNVQLSQQLQQQNAELNDVRNTLMNEQKTRITAETMLEDERRSLSEQKKILAEAETNLTSVFQGLAAQALITNSKDFMRLANQSFSGLRVQASEDLGSLLRPLADTLNTYQDNLHTIESARLQAYGEITASLRSVGETHEILRQETSNLVSALRRPNVRGRWGELTLRRVAELSGMSEHCDFTEQATMDTPEGQQRPDMIIHLPKDVTVPVDAKVPFDAYFDAMSATAENERKQHLHRYAGAVRARMKALSSKDYADQYGHAPDVTVLFLPSEAFLGAALEYDHDLLDHAMQKKILLATPVSLFSLLKAVAHGWQQESIAKNAQAISNLGKQLYDQIQTLWQHLDNLRSGLVKALKGFDATVASLESRLLPTVRKFKQLGATADAEIPALEPIATVPRLVKAAINPIEGGKPDS